MGIVKYRRIGTVASILLTALVLLQSSNLAVAIDGEDNQLPGMGIDLTTEIFDNLVEEFSLLFSVNEALANGDTVNSIQPDDVIDPVTYIYRNMYVWLDSIITFGYHLIKALQIIATTGTFLVAVVKIITAIASLALIIASILLPIDGVFKILLAVIVVLLACATAFFAFIKLVCVLMPYFLMALKKVRDQFPPPEARSQEAAPSPGMITAHAA